MLNKCFNFLKGYVIILLYGKNPERFINICLKRQIPVWGILRREGAMEIRVYMRDFKRLREIRRKTGVKIRIADKISLSRLLYRYRKRVLFAVCAILCAAAVNASSGRIWAVEINGVRNADILEVARLLEENGVFVGAAKKNLLPTSEIKNNVIAGCDELAWLWIYMEGSKARVEVSERRIPPTLVEREKASDIVSAADGVIKKITVKLGDPCVKTGDAVAAGDVLVSGKVRAYRDGEEENYLYVHSLGEVLAYTIHTAKTEQKLYDEIRTPTGNNKRYITLELFGKKYELFNEKATEFADYDIKTDCHELKLPFFGYTGLAMTVEKHIEVEPSKQEISVDLAVERAQCALEEQIAKELTPLADMTDKRVEYDFAGEDTIIVKCTMSFIENIGTEELIRSEYFDQQTN